MIRHEPLRPPADFYPADEWNVLEKGFRPLRDDQSERIKHLLPGRDSSVGVTASDNRLFVEAVLYRYRTGMPWRDLPERFGDGIKVHQRSSRWAKRGVWQQMFQQASSDPPSPPIQSLRSGSKPTHR